MAPCAWLRRDSRRTISQMNNATQPITVIFGCLKCGTIYQAKQHRGPGTHFGAFNCVACHSQVYAWSGLYDFMDWKVGFPARLATPPRK
jgi:hypothetical protein